MAVIINYVDELFDLMDKYEQGKLDNMGKAMFLRLCRWHDNDMQELEVVEDGKRKENTRKQNRGSTCHIDA